MAEGSRSSPIATAPWLRLAMPSVADMIFVALLSALVFTNLSVRLLGDAGIGWHIRTGQQILATHAIPRVDSFSSTMASRPWFAWEWLYDLVVGQLEATLGLNGVVWFTAVVIAAAFAWMFRLLILRRTNMLVALGLVLLGVSASMIHFLARPHVVSWLFTLAWFRMLDSSERDSLNGQGERLYHEGHEVTRRKSIHKFFVIIRSLGGSGTKRLWALPLLMLLWVNIHGGFLIGFVLWGIFLLGAGWTWFKTKEGRIEELLQRVAAAKRVRNLAWVGVLSAAASFVNPYGWKLHAHIYSYLSNRFLTDHIEEFQSPNFHGIAQRCFLAFLLITVAVLAFRGRELRMSSGLTVLFAVYAGLYASRNIPVSSILLVMIVGPLLHAPKFAQRFSQRMETVEVGLRGHVWPILAIVFTLAIAVNGGRIGNNRLMDAHFNPKHMPVEAANYLEKYGVKGPVLSPDSWGGYLIYRLYPKMRVVVDDRHDLYGEQFLKSYLKMTHLERGWPEFLDTHETSCILLPRDAALASILSETKGWKTLYEDNLSIVFVRDPVLPKTRQN